MAGLFKVWDGSAWVPVGRGEQGATGPTGAQGTQGNTGTAGSQGNTGIQGSTGATGVQGTTGSTGANGNTGATGPIGYSGGVEYTFSTTTTNSDPGNGNVRFNSGTIASVTSIYIDNVDKGGTSQTAWYDTFDDSTNSHKGYLIIGDNTATAALVFNVTAVASNTGYYTLTVTFVSGVLPANSTVLSMIFSRDGDKGNTGATGAAGNTGATGANGATGVQGTTGPTGATPYIPRVGSTASSATPSINTDSYDEYDITALAANITSMTTNLSGTPSNGQKLMLRFKDNGTARTITWGASFVSSGVATLLATTVISKTHYVLVQYDSTAAKWVCLAVDATGY